MNRNRRTRLLRIALLCRPPPQPRSLQLRADIAERIRLKDEVGRLTLLAETLRLRAEEAEFRETEAKTKQLCLRPLLPLTQAVQNVMRECADELKLRRGYESLRRDIGLPDS